MLEQFEFKRHAEKYAEFFPDEHQRKKNKRKLARSEHRYVAAASAFHDYCSQRGVASIPAREGILGDYLDLLIDGGASAETIKLVIDGISHRHKLAELFDPSEYELVKAISLCMSRKAAAQKNGNGKDHKPPTKTEDLN